MYQGSTDPDISYSINTGDYWLDSSTNALHVWSGTAWAAPRLADLHFVGSSIVAPAATDLTFTVDSSQYVIVDSGTSGPALITTDNDLDLHINPATGGGQYLVLVANRWPTTAGTSGQVLTTGALGVTSWQTPASILPPNYEEYVATASQTVFGTTMSTVAKSSGKAYLQVFVNGVFQQEGATKQFTVTGANQITFNAGLTLNSDVVIYGYA
jgi:hypothetical protein